MEDGLSNEMSQGHNEHYAADQPNNFNNNESMIIKAEDFDEDPELNLDVAPPPRTNEIN